MVFCFEAYSLFRFKTMIGLSCLNLGNKKILIGRGKLRFPDTYMRHHQGVTCKIITLFYQLITSGLCIVLCCVVVLNFCGKFL